MKKNFLVLLKLSLSALLFLTYSLEVFAKAPVVPVHLYDRLPANLKKTINQKVAQDIYNRYSQVRNAKDFDQIFLSQLSPKDRKEMLTEINAIKDFPKMVLEGDTVVFKGDKKDFRIQFLHPIEKTIAINGKKWTYSEGMSARKNMLRLKEFITGSPQTAWIRLLIPEAQAIAPLLLLAGKVAAVVGPMILIAAYTTVGEVASSTTCAIAKEKFNTDLREWGPFCRDWFKARAELHRKRLGVFDSFMNLDENKDLREKYELESLNCPTEFSKAGFSYKTKMRRTLQNPESTPLAPIDSDSEKSATPVNRANLRSWNNVSIKVRSSGAPEEILFAPEENDGAKSAENNILFRIRYNEDGSIESIGLRNTLFDPNDGSSAVLWYGASDVAIRVTEKKSSTEQEANLTSRLEKALEMVAYLQERTKECRRQLTRVAPASAPLPAAKPVTGGQ